jgi:hypothetical protein
MGRDATPSPCCLDHVVSTAGRATARRTGTRKADLCVLWRRSACPQSVSEISAHFHFTARGVSDGTSTSPTSHRTIQLLQSKDLRTATDSRGSSRGWGRTDPNPSAHPAASQTSVGTGSTANSPRAAKRHPFAELGGYRLRQIVTPLVKESVGTTDLRPRGPPPGVSLVAASSAVKVGRGAWSLKTKVATPEPEAGYPREGP